MSRTPWDAWTRPGLPTSIFGLRAFWSNGGSQPISSSAPPSIRTSASRSWTTKLGRASTKCESSVGFARTLMSTLSPPTSRASDPRSGRVATTLILACPEKAKPRLADRINRIFFILEFVGAMSAEDEFELEENRIGVPAGEEFVLLQEIVIVLEPDLREFGRIPGEVRGNAGARLAGVVGGERGFLHVEIIAAK